VRRVVDVLPETGRLAPVPLYLILAAGVIEPELLRS